MNGLSLGGGAGVVELVEVLLDVGIPVAVVAPHWKREKDGEIRLCTVASRQPRRWSPLTSD